MCVLLVKALEMDSPSLLSPQTLGFTQGVKLRSFIRNVDVQFLNQHWHNAEQLWRKSPVWLGCIFKDNLTPVIRKPAYKLESLKFNSDQPWVVLQHSHFALIAIKTPSHDLYKGPSGDCIHSTIISLQRFNLALNSPSPRSEVFVSVAR